LPPSQHPRRPAPRTTRNRYRCDYVGPWAVNIHLTLKVQTKTKSPNLPEQRIGQGRGGPTAVLHALPPGLTLMGSRTVGTRAHLLERDPG
jgi:hypothetical protein